MTPDISEQIAIWRQRIRAGEDLTQEEMRAAILAMRTARGKLSPVSGGSKVTKAKAAAKGKPNGDDLLSELEGM